MGGKWVLEESKGAGKLELSGQGDWELGLGLGQKSGKSGDWSFVG